MIPTFLILTLLACPPNARGATPVDFTIFSTGPDGVQVSWNVIHGRTCLLQSTTNFLAPWRDALPAPSTLTAATNSISQVSATDSVTGFFRVLLVDTVGPEVYRVEPVAGGIAVGRQAALRAWVRDDSGIVNYNSVKAKLVREPRPWLWSSGRFRNDFGYLSLQDRREAFQAGVTAKVEEA